tara:strand:+ start:139 stop:426 length:288 start_codon:yes stop_codon:yes gene_type:complete
MTTHEFGELQNLSSMYDFADGTKAEQYIKTFENGYTTSTIRHNNSYGGKQGLYEVGLLDSDDNFVSVDHITGDDSVVGFLTAEEVKEILNKVSML